MPTSFEMKGRLKDHVDLDDEAYRRGLVDAEIRRGIPIQIREIREARGWSQAQLGEMLGKPQNNISRMENTRDTYLSIPTLLEVASAFDVALMVRFVPYSELLRWVDNQSLETVVAKDYASEIADENARESDPTPANVVGSWSRSVRRSSQNRAGVKHPPRPK